MYDSCLSFAIQSSEDWSVQIRFWKTGYFVVVSAHVTSIIGSLVQNFTLGSEIVISLFTFFGIDDS